MPLFNRSTGTAVEAEPERPRTESLSSNEKDMKEIDSPDAKKIDVESLAVEEDVDSTIIKNDEDVAVEVCTFLLRPMGGRFDPWCVAGVGHFRGGRPDLASVDVQDDLPRHWSFCVHLRARDHLHVQAPERLRIAAVLFDYRLCLGNCYA